MIFLISMRIYSHHNKLLQWNCMILLLVTKKIINCMTVIAKKKMNKKEINLLEALNYIKLQSIKLSKKKITLTKRIQKKNNRYRINNCFQLNSNCSCLKNNYQMKKSKNYSHQLQKSKKSLKNTATMRYVRSYC